MRQGGQFQPTPLFRVKGMKMFPLLSGIHPYGIMGIGRWEGGWNFGNQATISLTKSG
jgi:hypothetical protein